MATAATAKAPPDGTAFMLASNAFLINPALHMKLPYDTLHDFAPISMVATPPIALVATKSFPADTLAAVIALAKAASEPINYTSPGPRTATHLAGIRMTHISYNGSAPALTDIIVGRVLLMLDVWHSARRYVQSRDLKFIAGAGLEPLPGAERVPTIATTFPGFNVVAFNAAIGPAGIPPPVLEQLSADIRAVVSSRAFAERTANLGIDAKGNTPTELDAWMRGEIDKWAGIAAAAHITAE